jgi:hypothetical protein
MRMRPRPSLALRLALVVSGLLLLVVGPASARPVGSHDAQWIAAHAQVIVVGQVTHVDILKHLPSPPGPYPSPKQERQVQVQVLRTFPAEGIADARPGQTLAIHYVTWDSPNGQGVETWYPEFAPGKYYGLPLIQKDGRWGFPEEEDFGMLFPCVAQALDAPRQRGEDFVRAELAGDFARGDFDMSYLAARWWGFMSGDGADAQAVAKLLEPAVGHDEARWLEIAVGAYTSLGIPPPTLAELAQGGTSDWGPVAVISTALQHLSVAGRDDRLIETAMQHLDADSYWGVATMLHDNYARHPLAVKLVGEALATNPFAIYVARDMLDGPTHLLTRLATSAAGRLLQGDIPAVPEASGASYPDYNLMVSACSLILRYGTEGEYQSLVQEIKGAQTHDRVRYRYLWEACAGSSRARLIPIIRVVIGDNLEIMRGYTYADAATSELQRTTGVDFGAKPDQTRAQLDECLARAQAWLAQHPDPPPGG